MSRGGVKPQSTKGSYNSRVGPALLNWDLEAHARTRHQGLGEDIDDPTLNW